MCGMGSFWRWDDALLFLRKGQGEMLAWLVGRQDAAIEGKGNLDLGFFRESRAGCHPAGMRRHAVWVMTKKSLEQV